MYGQTKFELQLKQCIMKLVYIYRRFVPENFRKFIHIGSIINHLAENYYIYSIKSKQKKALACLKGKEKIKCVFFALHTSVWKYDEIVKIMQDHPRFEPTILVCPVVDYGWDNMLKNMDDAYNFYKDRGFNVIKSYKKETNKYVNVKKELSPDIIFYTNPYKGLIDNRYFITNYRDILTVYVPYSFNNSCAFEGNYNLILYNLLWRHYLPTCRHYEYSVQYARNKGINSVVTGYPGIEGLIDKHRPICSDWKLSSNKLLKKIIWAPHHTIEPVGVVYFSCFFRYCDLMIEMAKKYQDNVLFVFKPHPLLRNKLYLRWGKEKTEKYYDTWKTMPNTSVNDGDYADLFLTSDAMIHDSGSFTCEYLYVNKPVMRTLNEVDESEKMNDLAMKCIDNHYLAHNEQDIEQFIQNVINGVDPLKEQRTKFVNEVLMPKGSPSLNIINDILDSIDNQILYRN